MSGVTWNISWESLLRATQRERLKERLTYYDLTLAPPLPGEEHLDHTRVAHEAIDQALRLFSGTVKAVRRSSGGITLAEPYQLIAFGDPEDPAATPAVRIRVRFRDFKRGPADKVRAGEYVTHMKTVMPEDLSEPFTIDPRSATQRFVVDFGHGTIPVHVFHCEKDETACRWAYFVELSDLDRIRHSAPGRKLWIQPYRVECNVLRLAVDEPKRGPVDYRNAVANYLRLRQDGYRPVPEEIRWAEPIAVPAGLGTEDIHKALREAFIPPKKDDSPPVYTLDENDRLKPFDE